MRIFTSVAVALLALVATASGEGLLQVQPRDSHLFQSSAVPQGAPASSSNELSELAAPHAWVLYKQCAEPWRNEQLGTARTTVSGHTHVH